MLEYEFVFLLFFYVFVESPVDYIAEVSFQMDPGILVSEE